MNEISKKDDEIKQLRILNEQFKKTEINSIINEINTEIDNEMQSAEKKSKNQRRF